MIYDLQIINAIKDHMVNKRLTLSVAESVTAGHLQAALSAADEASRFFQGGITAYNAGQKCRHLNIEPIYALQDNCVSEKVSCQMATEVNKLFISDYGIGITGYATKVPEVGVNDLFAFFAIASGNRILVAKKIATNKESSVDVQIDYTTQVLVALRALIQ
jgi:PncC family amidohydrolase